MAELTDEMLEEIEGYLDQHAMMLQLDQELLNTVHARSLLEPRTLRVSHLRALVAEVRRLRAALLRISAGEDMRSWMTTT